MTVSKYVVVSPKNANLFFPVQKAVFKHIHNIYIEEAKKLVQKNSDLFAVHQLPIRSQKSPEWREKFGVWRKPQVHSSDFESFELLFGFGDESVRSAFITETNDKHPEIINDHRVITFTLGDWGNINELCQIIRNACLEFGDVYILNNDQDIIE